MFFVRSSVPACLAGRIAMPVELISPSSDGFFSGYWCSAISKKRAFIQPWCDLVVSIDVDISVAWHSHVVVS